MSENRFYICRICKNTVGLIHAGDKPLSCCGEWMVHMPPRNDNQWEDKHAPRVTVCKNKVTVDVGEVMHPQTDSHGISWIYLQTDRGGQRKCLEPNTKPSAEFAICDEKPTAAYAFCNMHGLWKTDIDG